MSLALHDKVSIKIKRTLKTPCVLYKWVGFFALEMGDPSPKFHSYLALLSTVCLKLVNVIFVGAHHVLALKSAFTGSPKSNLKTPKLQLALLLVADTTAPGEGAIGKSLLPPQPAHTA